MNDPVRGIQPTRDCPEFLVGELSKIDLDTQILEHQGFFSVLARCGEGRPVTLLLAHFDVVPIGPGWETDPFKLIIKEDKGFGRGAADDKGNVTALLLAAEAIANLEVKGTVAFAMTGDEEIGGTNGATVVREILEKNGQFPDYLITADGVGMCLVTRRRNTIGMTVSVPKEQNSVIGSSETHRFTTDYVGRQSRHSAYFLPGVDRHALLAASSFLLNHPDIIVQQAVGSYVKSNVVPDWFEVKGVNPNDDSAKQVQFCDRNLTALVKTLLPLSRTHFPAYPSDYGITICPNLLYEKENNWEVYCDGRAMTIDSKSVEVAVQSILAEKLGTIPFQLTVRMGKAFMNTSSDSKIVKTGQKVATHLGLKTQPIELGGASDTRHFTDQPIEAIDFGPLGFGVHGSNEYVLLDSIPQTATFYTQLVNKLHSPL